jgi:leader peptidase (prepilin peptidase) / N-methyltransferase
MNDYLSAFATFPWRGFFSVLSFAWGACIGSFLNVCVFRIPRELSVVTPRSFCPHCSKQIAWYHNIPLFSYLALGGKCAYCGGRISPRYFLIELLTAVLFLLIWLKFDLTFGPRPLHLDPIVQWQLVPVYWLAISGLILGTFVDFEHLIIPDRVTLGGIAAGLVLSALVPAMHCETSILRGLMFSAIGAAVGWGLLWTVGAIGTLALKKEAMGFGDVKLIGAIGAFLGWQAVLFTIMVSSLAGSIVGIALVTMRKREMQSRIPYGPYLALAALIWILWGPVLWDGYIQLLTPKSPPLQ